MAINFDEATVEQLEKDFIGLSDERKAKIDALAAMLFVNLHMVGLAHSSLPKTVPSLERRELAKLRLLATTLEAVYGMTSVYHQ